jgi:hypothetical protein
MRLLTVGNVEGNGDTDGRERPRFALLILPMLPSIKDAVAPGGREYTLSLLAREHGLFPSTRTPKTVAEGLN